MTIGAGGKEGDRHLSSLDSIIHKQRKKTVRYVTKQQGPEISNTCILIEKEMVIMFIDKEIVF